MRRISSYAKLQLQKKGIRKLLDPFEAVPEMDKPLLVLPRLQKRQPDIRSEADTPVVPIAFKWLEESRAPHSVGDGDGDGDLDADPVLTEESDEEGSAPSGHAGDDYYEWLFTRYPEKRQEPLSEFKLSDEVIKVLKNEIDIWEMIDKEEEQEAGNSGTNSQLLDFRAAGPSKQSFEFRAVSEGETVWKDPNHNVPLGSDSVMEEEEEDTLCVPPPAGKRHFAELEEFGEGATSSFQPLRAKRRKLAAEEVVFSSDDEASSDSTIIDLMSVD